ncbi:MAG: LysM peptidoglycan-binding domain-containing protein [Bacteroidota bacterium]
MKFLYIIIILFSLSLFYGNGVSIAQPDSFKTQIIDGRKYYIHTVVKGETLYAISRKYGVEVKEIALENPLTINGLKTGQVIKIPIPFKTISAKSLDGKYIFHTVEQGQTFYSLSKKFSVSIDDIKSANPELAADILKVGSTIRIPLASHSAKDVPDTAQMDILSSTVDTIYIHLPNGDSLAATGFPGKAPAIEKPELVFRSIYNVAVMLPFYLDMNDSISADKSMDEPEEMYSRSEIALGFYEGTLLAVDSLKKQGLSVRMFIYDTNNDTNKVIELLQKDTLRKMDLIIGPLYLSNLSIAAKFAMENKINIVSPFISTNRILRGNPYLSKANPCVQTSIEEIASYIADKYVSRQNVPDREKNFIAVHNNDPGEKLLFNIFQDKLLSFFSTEKDSTGGAPPGIQQNFKKPPVIFQHDIKEIAYNERGMEAVEEALSVADTNIIIIPSSDQVFVSQLISKLNELEEDYKIIVFGLPVWENFKNIEIEYLQNLNVHITSSSFIDYESEPVKSFVKQYYKLYKIFPGKYAFQGFDVVYYYLNILKNFGYNFQTYLPEIDHTGVHTSYKYFSTGINNGYENRYVIILKYEDYELVKKK